MQSSVQERLCSQPHGLGTELCAAEQEGGICGKGGGARQGTACT